MSQICDDIRKAIEASGKSRYQLWKESGIDQGQLSRLMKGERGLSLDNLQRLANTLGLEIVVRKQRKGR